MPPLKFRGGLTLHHGPLDEPIKLFREMFVPRSYTCEGFYRPMPSDVVMDVGANIGLFALFLQWCAPGIKVHCFEPGAYALDLLRKNIGLNRLDSAVAIHPYAVSAQCGVGRLSDAAVSTMRELKPRAADGPAAGETIETVDLPRALELCRTGHVDLLKMDIEGSEYEVINAAPPRAWEPIERVALEFHDYLHPGCREVVTRRLREAGFNWIRVVTYWPAARFGILHAGRR